jgi:uncharacterized protein (UPF0332 family)
MTREQSYKKDLIKYRIDCANESLHDACILKDNGGSPSSIVNRSYYSIFYAALALLVTADTEPSKHSGVLAKFDELFIRQGIFPKEMSKILHHAFDMRQAGDYQKSKVITQEQAIQVFESAEEFVKTIKAKII